MREIRLEVLGPLSINGKPVSSRKRIANVVVAVLAMQATYRHQEFVSAIWPGEDVETDGAIDPRVQDKLHSTLKLVRAQLEVGHLLRSNYPLLELSRDPADDVVVTSDADDFNQLRKSQEREDGLAALRLVRGDLAQGLNTNVYQEEWISARRGEFRNNLSLLLTRLIPDDSSDVQYLLQRVLSGEGAVVADSLSATGSSGSPKTLRNKELINWLSAHFHKSPGDLTARLASIPRHRHAALTPVTRQNVADVLRSYYEPFTADLRPVSYSVDSSDLTYLSVASCPRWLGLNVALRDPMSERAVLVGDYESHEVALDLDTALHRLREVEDTDTRIVNNPIFRLLHIDIEDERLSTTYSLDNFAAYAFSADCLENELLTGLGGAGPHESMPLRDSYLPNIEAVLNLGTRVCAGGPVALFAAARPAAMGYNGQRDYVLLVQERSHEVLNVSGRLAVIPKAFHQPLVEPAAEVRLISSIRRELEEELMGRSDLDPASDSWTPLIDPQHSSRLSLPMRWLWEHEDEDEWRAELTGFGFNLVSGNFEFATLVVVDDEDWWHHYGGLLELGWETSGIVRYSSLDRRGLGMLLSNERWSNEGLFAMLCGLQRLGESGHERVDLPAIRLDAEK